MIIKYKDRHFIDRYRCIDYIKSEQVQCFAFIHMNLLYYKKNQFDYLIIDKDDLIEEVNL